MSRLFTLERSTVLSAMAIALAVAMFPPAGNLRAEDAAKDEATAEQAAGDGASSPGFAEDLSNRAQDLRSADPGAKSEPEAQSAAQPDTPKSETADSPETPAPQTEAAETPSPAAPAQDASQAAEAKPGDVTPAAAKPADPKSAAAKPGQTTPDDYYSKRAKEMLKADTSAADLTPHPLAAAHPDQFVVVCEAGCSHGKSAEIVYMAPKPRAEATQSELVPTSTDGGPSSGIDCVGGCYGKTPKAYGGRADATAVKTASADSSWITTVSGEQPGAASGAAGEKPAKPVSKNGGSGDWMAKIDLDQGKSGVKAPVETAPTAPAAAPAAPAANGTISKPDKVDAAAQSPAPLSAKPADAKPGNTKPDAAPPADAAAAAPAPAAPVAEAPKPEGAKADAPPADAPAAASAGEAKAENAPAEVAAPAAGSAAGSTDQTALKAEAPKADAPKAPAAMAETPADAPKAEAAPSGAPKAPAAEAEGQKTGDNTAVAALEPAAAPAPNAPKAEAAQAPVKPGLAIDGKAIDLDAKDAEVNAAVKKARAGLSDFLRAMDKPAAGETNFSLKVAVRGTNGIVEHFWLVDVKRQGDHLAGKINNEPEYVRGIEMGQIYEFTEAQVTDWLFKRNGKMVGNETLRPLLRRMAKEEAAPYWAMYEKP